MSRPAPVARRAWLALLGGLCAGLAGCTFSPVYGPGGTGLALRDSVLVSPPFGDDEFLLSRALEDRLGPPDGAVYDLTFSLDTTTERIAITASQDTNRFNIVGSADWQLRRRDTGAIVAGGTVESFTSYAATGTPVATQAAERDGRERLMRILSDKIMTRLLTSGIAT